MSSSVTKWDGWNTDKTSGRQQKREKKGKKKAKKSKEKLEDEDEEEDDNDWYDEIDYEISFKDSYLFEKKPRPKSMK